MKYSVRKNWVTSFELLTQKPFILVPFVVIAFLEAFALELIYFSPRKPIMYVANPIIRKFFGESFLHYPQNLLLMPKLFYYAQIVIYIFLGVFLSAIVVNLVKNVRTKLPVKPKALIKNSLNRYFAFVAFGILAIIMMFLVKNFDIFLFNKGLGFVARYLPQTVLKAVPFGLGLLLFIANIIVNTFLVLTVPIIVIKKSSLLKALMESIYLGFRNFFTIFSIKFVPYLVYLPIILLKSYPAACARKTFPEIIPLTSVLGIVVSMFVECFVIVCLSQFLLDTQKKSVKQ